MNLQKATCLCDGKPFLIEQILLAWKIDPARYKKPGFE
jgi:hypothetical protein